MNDAIKLLSHDELVALVLKQAAEIQCFKAEIQSLKEQLAKATRTSANSSKRPSSDIVKPKKQKHSRKKN